MQAPKKRYRVIAKIGNLPNGQAHCVKYHVNDLLQFVTFLDKHFPTWRWCNVYDKATGQPLTSFTKYRRPTAKFVQKRE